MSEDEFGAHGPPDVNPEVPQREQLLGGRLLAEIADRLALLGREHYGRDSIKAKTYVLDNLVGCVLVHRARANHDGERRARPRARNAPRVPAADETRYSEMIEEVTGRKVLAFLSQTHIEPNLTVEMFLMDGRLPGFGALELVLDHGAD
jgi:uncharacterized protein YbcI